MTYRKLNPTELRRVERIANNFDDWAGDQQGSIAEVCDAVLFSICQQLVRAGGTEEHAHELLTTAWRNAINPGNKPVFLADGSKGDA